MIDPYDQNNVFAKIINKEIPCNAIYEDNHVLCFEDISKSAKIHWLVIPKTPHKSFHDFISNSDDKAIAAFFKTIKKITEENNLDKFGYKLVTNNGERVGQSVFHFHMHILSGETMKGL